MNSVERLSREKTVLENVGVLRVGALQKELLPKLASVYFRTWSPEGLCESLSEATEKMAAFNPNDTYVVINENRVIYALIQTLPIKLDSLDSLPRDFPTYYSVEKACMDHTKAINPNILLCFSINVLPDYLVRISEKETQPLVLYLLNKLDTLPGAGRIIAYSRFKTLRGDPLKFYLDFIKDTRAWGPVGIHEIKGITTHIIKQARPEDIKGGGCNVVVVYPRNPEEAAHFNRIKLRRRQTPPDILTSQENVITFADTIDLCL